MLQESTKLQVSLRDITPHACKAVVFIPSAFTQAMYQEASLHQQHSIHTYGFQRGSTPLEYIEQNYKSNLTEHLKEFFFKYCVISFLYQEIVKNKLLVAGQPRLENVTIEPRQQSEFHFDLSLIPSFTIMQWKEFNFKAPKRKNYKDIDRQVDAFLKEETNNTQQNDTVNIFDWVCFDIVPANKNKEPLIQQYRENLWLRIGDEEADQSLQEVFLHKKIGDILYSNNNGFQEYFSNDIDSDYLFCIAIKDILPHNFFDLEQFKHHFMLKSLKDIQIKLIEVFSFRNDISQRRTMVEDALRLLMSKHSFDIPNYLILRQQKLVLESVQQNPDYLVYKNQPDFADNIRHLATKQIKETLLIDQLCYTENMAVTHDDVKGYLNLLKRARTKEFIYFNPPSTKIKGQEIPLSTELLKRYCLREKTLNHVIHYLTRK